MYILKRSAYYVVFFLKDKFCHDSIVHAERIHLENGER